MVGWAIGVEGVTAEAYAVGGEGCCVGGCRRDAWLHREMGGQCRSARGLVYGDNMVSRYGTWPSISPHAGQNTRQRSVASVYVI